MTHDLTLEIPGEILDTMRLPPDQIRQELLQELALALYRRGVLPSGKAQILARVTRWEFEELLKRRQIPRHYTEVDLESDLAYAHRHQ